MRRCRLHTSGDRGPSGAVPNGGVGALRNGGGTVKKGLVAVSLVVAVLGLTAPAFAEEPLPGGRPPCSIMRKTPAQPGYQSLCQHPDHGW